MLLADLHELESQLLGIHHPQGVVGVAVEERLHRHPRLSLPHQLLLQQGGRQDEPFIQVETNDLCGRPLAHVSEEPDVGREFQSRIYI